VAEVQVQNTGERTGTEVVQCYLHDKVTSVTWPIKSLVDFKRVTLKPAEKKTVRFEIPYDALAIIDGACKRVVEPGAFELLIGTSSRDRDLKPLAFTVTGSK
jgi:beta-glucosidase